jgi:hypothetical protein
MQIYLVISIIFCFSACGPLESGVIDSGWLNTGGTNDPRRLITVAYSRMYESKRIIGARNVLRRAINISEKNGDLFALAVSCNMMGDTYIYEEKDPKMAEEYYNRALPIVQNNRYNCELVETYIGFALSNELRGLTDISCNYALKCKGLMEKIKEEYHSHQIPCEGGSKTIFDTEKRLSKLFDHLNCKNISQQH